MTDTVKLSDFLGLSKQQFFGHYAHLNIEELLNLIDHEDNTLATVVHLIENKILTVCDRRIAYRHMGYPSIVATLDIALKQEDLSVQDIENAVAEDNEDYQLVMRELSLEPQPVHDSLLLAQAMEMLIELGYIKETPNVHYPTLGELVQQRMSSRREVMVELSTLPPKERDRYFKQEQANFRENLNQTFGGPF